MEPMKNVILRHEYKYVCSSYQMEQIKGKINYVLDIDKNVNLDDSKDLFYRVRSLYFDTYNNKYYNQNEDGVDNRYKFRIRYYNSNMDLIKLEKKGKLKGKTYKESCVITREQCEHIMNKNFLEFHKPLDPLLEHFLYIIKTEGLKPVIIVEYDRRPYILEYEQIRVTLDMNIRSSKNVKAFLQDDIVYRMIMPTGYHLLEVKWNSFIPKYITDTLMVNNLQWSAFSKYYLCRKFKV